MNRFASNVADLRSLEIRDLMSFATALNMTSFTGGLPDNELFPIDTGYFGDADPKKSGCLVKSLIDFIEKIKSINSLGVFINIVIHVQS